MARASGGKNPPELLSTHPAHETRIRDLQAGMEKALALYERAKAEGRGPGCRRPAAGAIVPGFARKGATGRGW